MDRSSIRAGARCHPGGLRRVCGGLRIRLRVDGDGARQRSRVASAHGRRRSASIPWRRWWSASALAVSSRRGARRRLRDREPGRGARTSRVVAGRVAVAGLGLSAPARPGARAALGDRLRCARGRRRRGRRRRSTCRRPPGRRRRAVRRGWRRRTLMRRRLSALAAHATAHWLVRRSLLALAAARSAGFFVVLPVALADRRDARGAPRRRRRRPRPAVRARDAAHGRRAAARAPGTCPSRNGAAVIVVPGRVGPVATRRRSPATATACCCSTAAARARATAS